MSVTRISLLIAALLLYAQCDAQGIAASGSQVAGALTNSLRSWLSNSSNIDTVRNVLLNPNDAVTRLVSSRQALNSLAKARETVSGDCLQHVLVFTQALSRQEDWALRMMDAIGKPPAGLLSGKILWLGDWNECINTEATVYENFSLKSNPTHPFTGKYCSVNFPTSLLGMFSVPGVFTVGVCLPNTCSSSDATALGKLLVDVLPSDIGNFTIPDPQITCQETDLPLDRDAIIVIVVCSIFLAVILLATVYDVVYVQWLSKKKSTTGPGGFEEVETKKSDVYIVQNESVPDTKEKQNGVDLSPIENGTSSIQGHSFAAAEVVDKDGRGQSREERNKPGVLEGILLSFSVFTNGTKILKTHQPKGALTAVNGIRFLSMTWVVIGHGFGQFVVPSTDNALQYSTSLIRRREFTAIFNGTFSVDTFFVLSGLLVSYLSLRELKKCKGVKNFKWGMYYFHRFWRLTPPYMLLLLIWVPLNKYYANGPLWPQGGFSDATACKKQWWINLLYINNLVKQDDQGACVGWAWYLANDMQFYVISPLVLVPFYYSWILGGLACLSLLLTSAISSGVVTWYYNLPPPTVFTAETQAAFMWYYYVKPWCRVGPYAVGLFTGYMLYRTKLNMKINRYVNVLLWVMSIVLGCLIVYGIYAPDNTSPLSPNMTALYNSTARSVWGACVAWVIFACANGYGGPVNHLLSWPGFVPLGRLTYFAYLCHIILMEIHTATQLSVVTAYDYGVIYVLLGHLCMSYAASFVLSLAFEAPMMSLEKVLLGRDKNS